MIKKDELVNSTKQRLQIVRLRTWTLTLVLALGIVFYILVQVTWSGSINLVDLAFLGAVQIVVHCLYFPDGDLFGQQSKSFIANKEAYNEKASSINEHRKVDCLREYCKVEFEARKQRYINSICGTIGINEKDFELLKQKSPKEIKSLESFENDGKIVFFTKKNRKILYNLIFKPLPIEENSPDTILSAIEINYKEKIKDKTDSYKTSAYVSRILKSTIVAVFLAYLGYEMRDGITFAIVVKMITILASIFTTAVMSFAKGEKCSKVYKNNFYLELSNFIDEFSGWLLKEKQYDLKKPIDSIQE